MSWLSVIQLTKPQDTMWFEQAFPEQGYANLQLIQSHGVQITAESLDTNTTKVTFTYASEQAYNDFQAFYQDNDLKIEKDQYDDYHNIVDTRIYLGPSENYIP